MRTSEDPFAPQWTVNRDAQRAGAPEDAAEHARAGSPHLHPGPAHEGENETGHVEDQLAGVSPAAVDEVAGARHKIDVPGAMYVRVRGTSTSELEPEPDAHGADPWADLWFHSNPVFIRR